jgi:SAP domain
MAAPRASSFKALRNLQKVSRSTPTKRDLHITGVHASPSPIDPTHKTTYTPWSLQDLRGECQKRTLSASGTKHELIDRLAGHDSLQARAFSIATRRISREQTKKPVNAYVDAPFLFLTPVDIHSPSETTPRRQFNTSQSLKAVGDTSTIDFAFLPKLFEAEWGPQPAAIRVPILPHIDSDDAEAVLEKFPQLEAAAGGYQDTTGHSTQMKPEISAVNELSASAMSDVHDGHHATEMSVEMLTALTETVGKSARQLVDKVKETEENTIRQLWSGLLDDLLGPKKK